jgi:hypothetical protein
MKRTALSCSLFLALAIAAVAAAPNSQGKKTVPRDISGVMDGRFTFRGPVQGPWTTTGDTTGTLGDLGLVRMYTTHTADADGTLSDGEFRIVAANGDEIRGTYTASGFVISNYTQALAMATFSIEKGTGRFAHARGTINAAFLETFDDPSWASAKVTWALEGTVRS